MLLKINYLHPDHQGLYWTTAIKPQHSSDNCPHIKYLAIKDYFAVKTDGSRIHAYMLNQYKPDMNGFYLIVKRTKREIILARDDDYDVNDYPDWESLFPGNKKFELFNMVQKKDYPEFIYTNLVTQLKEQIIKFDYIKDLFCIDNMLLDQIYYEKYTVDNNGFRFKSDNKLAAIMPVQKNV